MSRMRLVGLITLIGVLVFALSRTPASANTEKHTAPITAIQAAPNAAPTNIPGLRQNSGKMSSHLAELTRVRGNMIAQGGLNAIQAMEPLSVVVTPEQGVSLDQMSQIVTAYGGVVQRVYQHSLLASIAPPSVVSLASRPETLVIEEPTTALPSMLQPMTGSVTSEGVASMGADDWLANNWKGAGINIGIVDVGFSDYPDLQDNYAGVNEYSCVKGSMLFPPFTDIGRTGNYTRGALVAQVVCDVAPFASVYVIRIANFEDMKTAVDRLIALIQSDTTHNRSAEKIIMVSGMNATRPQGPGDGTFPSITDPSNPTGPDGSNSAIHYAQNKGILWVNMAGNYRLSHWSGDDVLNAIGFEPFAGGDTFNRFTWRAAAGPVAITLRWSGSWPLQNRETDFNLYVTCGPNGEYTAKSENQQLADTGGNYPYPREYLIFPDPNASIKPTTDVDCAIQVKRMNQLNSPPAAHLDLFVLSPQVVLSHSTPGSSVPSEENALSVGSYCVWNNTVDATSSYGPLNNADDIGAPNPNNTMKPDVVGPASVSTSLTPVTSQTCPIAFPYSEAGAAHVAGEAALVWGNQPGSSYVTIANYIIANAVKHTQTGEGNGFAHLGAPPADVARTPTLNWTPSVSPTATVGTPTFTPIPSSTPDFTLTPPTPTQLPGPIDSIGVYNRSSGTFSLRMTNTSGPADITIQAGDRSTYPVVGDWDGDGWDTVGLYLQRVDVFLLWDSNTQAAVNGQPSQTLVFGNPGDVPISGRWVTALQNDNVGRQGRTHDGVGVFRPSNDIFYLISAWPATPTAVFADYFIVLGNPGDQPFAGKWQGATLDTLGVARPPLAHYYITTASCEGVPPGPNARCQQFSVADTLFGVANDDTVVKGDWVGLREDGIGAFRFSNGVFYLLNAFPRTSNATQFVNPDSAVVFGSPGDIPLAGHWKPSGLGAPSPGNVTNPGFRSPTPRPGASPTATREGGSGGLD